MRYETVRAKSALHRLEHGVPYSYDLNVYRGCQHGCRYCFAQYSHGYLNDPDFFSTVYVKTNIAECLERELSNPRWKRALINLGGVTDSYQEAEATFRLMPDIWRLLIRYRTPACISTKSDLILRDFDLIAELSRTAYASVASTVTAMEDAVQRELEPGAVSTRRRLDMLKTFSAAGIPTGLHAMPLVPYFTDSTENIDALCRAAKEAETRYALFCGMKLTGKTCTRFFAFLERRHPELVGRFSQLYRTGHLDTDYKRALHEKVALAMQKYDLSSDYLPQTEKDKQLLEQLRLF